MKKWIRGIRAQLLIMGLIPVVVLTLLVFISMRALNHFSEKIEVAYSVRAKLIEAAGEIDSSVHAVGRWMWLSFVTKDKETEKNKFLSKAENEIVEIDETIENYTKLPRNPKIQDLFKGVEKEWPLAKTAAQEAIKELKESHLRDSDKIKNLLLNQFASHLIPITATMNQIKDEMHRILENEITESNEFSRSTTQSLFILSLLSMLLCLAISIFIAIRLTFKLTHISSILFEASSQVNSASKQIAASSEGLSQSTTEQAAALEQTAASLEEISSMINKTTDGAKHASESSSESQLKAEDGKKSIEQMIHSMDEIKQSNDSIMSQINYSNQQLGEIVKVIQEIGEKTKVINDIVFQTKLLSFNASVEAARAGEHGKGFAVVAEEVGNLAQMSGNAAREISDMLAGSISRVEKIVQETKSKVETLIFQGRQKVESGSMVAQQCADILTEIVENISKAAHYTKEISLASQEQSLGVSEINKAMGQMDTVTQQNAATSEQTASSAEELSAQAQSLNQSVEELLKIIEGVKSQHHQDKLAVAPDGSPNMQQTVTATPMTSQKEKRRGAKVIHFKANSARRSNETQAYEAIDESSIPDRKHAGFKDI